MLWAAQSQPAGVPRGWANVPTRAGYERDLARARESVPYKSQQQPEADFDAYSGQLNYNSPAFPNAGFIPRGLYRPFHPMRNTGGLRIITPQEGASESASQRRCLDKIKQADNRSE